LPKAAETVSLASVIAIRILNNLGRGKEADGFVERFRTVGDRTGQPRLVAWWHGSLGFRLCFGRGEPFDALEHACGAKELAQGVHDPRLVQLTEVFRGMSLWLLGEHEPARLVLEGVKVADTGLGMTSSVRRFCLAWAHADRGALDDARSTAVELCE